MFKHAHITYTKELKQILRFKGVYTSRINMSLSKAVAKFLCKEEYLK
jgi:hypothetical protein